MSVVRLWCCWWAAQADDCDSDVEIGVGEVANHGVVKMPIAPREVATNVVGEGDTAGFGRAKGGDVMEAILEPFASVENTVGAIGLWTRYSIVTHSFA